VWVETGYRLITVGAIQTETGWVLIDTPPYPRDAWHWRETLADIAPLPVLAVVLTDGHRDRLLGTCWFGAPTVIAHDETLAQMTALPSTFLDSVIETLARTPAEREQFASARLVMPTITFSQRMILHYGACHIALLSMPGPMAGSIWVHLPEQRVLFMGDSLSVDEHPYISGPHTKEWLDNLTELRRPRFAADRLVSGRGPVVDKDATEPLSNYLRLVRRRVQGLYRAGRPRADTASLVPELLTVFPYDPADSENVQRRIKSGLDRVYEELKANEKGGDSPAR
jgi:glyoxylase-like metal-dependent hydrolase (beta-lactamase superfamily II)